jgi:hypothetical protein
MQAERRKLNQRNVNNGYERTSKLLEWWLNKSKIESDHSIYFMTFPVLTINGMLQDFGNYEDRTEANKCSILELKQYIHT